MNKKIMLLALGAISAMMLAVPAASSATFESLHTIPTPAKLDLGGVGHVTLRSSSGNTTCTSFSGTMFPGAGGTTGTMQLTLGGCTGPGGGTCTSSSPAHTNGSVTTTVLPYHLVTLKGKSPGILITPGSGAFFHVNCIVLGFPVQTTFEGNGLLGTITAPACGGTSSTATVSFKAAEGTTTQQHRQVAGTTEGTIYSLSKGGNPASLEAHATLTATNAEGKLINSTLVCT